MINLGNVLVVPLGGPLRAYESEAPIDVVALLTEEYGGRGTYVHFDLDVDGERTGRLAFFARNPEDPQGRTEPNERARLALIMLMGVHMLITGPAAFIGLTPEKSLEVIQATMTE